MFISKKEGLLLTKLIQRYLESTVIDGRLQEQHQFNESVIHLQRCIDAWLVGDVVTSTGGESPPTDRSFTPGDP